MVMIRYETGTVDNMTFLMLVEYRDLERLVCSLESKGKELSYRESDLSLSLSNWYKELVKMVRLEQGNIRYALGYTDIDKFNEFMDKELGR